MFSPGETVNQTFTIPFAPVEISKVIVSYRQKDHIVLVKPITSGFSVGDTSDQTILSVGMTQDESLMFEDNCDYYVQLNVYTSNGTRAASREIKDYTGPQQYKKVINNV